MTAGGRQSCDMTKPICCLCVCVARSSFLRSLSKHVCGKLNIDYLWHLATARQKHHERARRRELHKIVSALPQISAAHTPETNRDTPRAPPHACTPLYSRSTVSINYFTTNKRKILALSLFWHDFDAHFLGVCKIIMWICIWT
jgi:hypothetical protein